VKLFAFAGSRRAGSLNKKLARLAAGALRDHGAEVDLADFREFELPVYDGDLEAESGVPAGVLALRGRITAAEGLVIATPEYNNSVPGAVKNAVDWLSRARPMPFPGLPTLILSASPGLAGGSRGAWALKVPLELLGAFVYPNVFTLPRANEAFAEDGSLKEAAVAKRLAQITEQFLDYARKLRAHSPQGVSAPR
jgi:NAD(P)H-dependent FMN reductase